MSEYETDDEKVESIKKWWKENGTSVVAGVALGLAVVFGWRTWTDHRNSVSGEASAAFEQLLASAAAGDVKSTTTQAQLLRQGYASTPYPAFGDLVAAKVLYDSGDTAAAMAALQQVVAKAPDPALQTLAALRLARIQLAEGQLDATAATLATHDHSAAFAGDFAAVRGDLAAARGDTAGARAAYEKAITAGTGLPQLIRLKLDNLPAPG
ncbi:tetratricopeptide repeat protein [uncultured Thiodictyon sp.]|uniref:YfgM family protein n=1 Tax=uncultured Thiodictyon sp. TaxID=1846217 RepID=UPI0025E8F84C|nr:tetratricopeptide repeat protein [uncultured Thiodictyon sp.]